MPDNTITDPSQFLHMTDQQLDELFGKSASGEIPEGEGAGTAIIKPGSDVSDDIARFIHLFTWKGKVFDPVTGTLKNKIQIGRAHV